MTETILSMTEPDIDHVHAVELACFSVPWSRRSFVEELRNPRSLCLVVKIRDPLEKCVICAYSCNHIVGNELEILRMAVSPESRRLGMGNRLLDAVLSQAMQQGVTEAFLEVRPSNSAAVALYGGKGFETIGRRLNYYSETGEDALVMMKRLKEKL